MGEKQHRDSVFYSVFEVRDFFVEKRIVPGIFCAKNESGNEAIGIVFGQSGGEKTAADACEMVHAVSPESYEALKTLARETLREE